MASRAHARAVLKYHSEWLLGLRNVVAAAVGRKVKKGKVSSDGWCIRVHVTRKTLRPSRHSIPLHLPPPPSRRHLGDVETDVIQTGRPQLHAGRSGVVVGPRQIVKVMTTGTIGCILQSSVGRKFALTAGHVLSPALVVDGLRNGTLESGALRDAQLPEYPVKFGTCVRCSRPTRYVDLGLIRIWDEFEVRPSTWITGFRVVHKQARWLVAGEEIRVLRVGRMMRAPFPEGADSDGVVVFHYPSRNGGMVPLLVEDIVFYPRAGDGAELVKGDSGSAVIDASGNLIGIHIGSSDGGPRDGNGLALGYAVGSASIRDWARGYSLLVASGTLPLE